MNRIIVFDFNRTLYDPDRGALVPDARVVLRVLRRRGFRLYVLSRAAPGRRQFIRDLGIRSCVHRVFVVRGRKDVVLRALARRANGKRYVVGDRVSKEIRAGNRFGFVTIWVRHGRFASERPANHRERPTHTVRALRDMLRLIR